MDTTIDLDGGLIDPARLPPEIFGSINFDGPVCPKLGTKCWEWIGKRKSRNGYGRFRCDGKERAAHRVVYEKMIGPIPAGHILDHQCRNHACVRPEHLEPVTHQVNTLRGDAVLFKAAGEYGRGTDITNIPDDELAERFRQMSRQRLPWGEDEATDAALHREAEANQLWTDHERKAGRLAPDMQVVTKGAGVLRYERRSADELRAEDHWTNRITGGAGYIDLLTPEEAEARKHEVRAESQETNTWVCIPIAVFAAALAWGLLLLLMH